MSKRYVCRNGMIVPMVDGIEEGEERQYRRQRDYAALRAMCDELIEGVEWIADMDDYAPDMRHKAESLLENVLAKYEAEFKTKESDDA